MKSSSKNIGKNINKKANRLKHWIDTYKLHSKIIYEVDADIYQNKELTKKEMKMVESLIEKGFRKKIKNPILDLACGQGRHSIYLAQKGFDVLGLDYSFGFLEIAKGNARKANVENVRFLQGDMRHLPFDNESFSTVLLLGNSFGYFSDSDNEKIILEVFRVLKKEGIFVFDITDKNPFLECLISYARYKVKTPSFGLVIDERWKSWDEKTKRINCKKKHTTRRGEVLLETPYVIRLYEREEIKNLLARVGFRIAKIKKFKGAEDLGLMRKRLFIGCVK